jgi:hypothetical protein
LSARGSTDDLLFPKGPPAQFEIGPGNSDSSQSGTPAFHRLKGSPTMDYTRFIKKLELPAGAALPTRLTYDNLVATAISRAHLQDDVAGINASIELIQRTRGGRWPTGPVSEEHNYVDLVWHEAEFRDGSSFTYAVYESDKCYLGCCYLSPLGRRTTLTEGLLVYDVDVSWWVTPAAYRNGHYARLYAALQHWLASEFSLWKPYYSNAEIPR